MNTELNKLIKAMECGWKRVPKMCYGFFEYRRFSIKNRRHTTNIKAACAMGHALIGIDSTNVENLAPAFPILQSQKVTGAYNRMSKETLETAINVLVFKGWKTPEIVEWLKTHLDD